MSHLVFFFTAEGTEEWLHNVCGDMLWVGTHPLRSCVTFDKSLNLSEGQPCCLEEENVSVPLCVLAICWESLSMWEEPSNPRHPYRC